MGSPIYLDNNSTTQVDPLVVEAMLPYFTRCYGNASNETHRYGDEAARAVEMARRQLAELIGARTGDIVFTSGATESNNLAIFGAARRFQGRGDHIVTVATEHKAVLEPCRELEREGFHVTVLPVDRDGRVSPGDVSSAITGQTLLVSVMAANNEIGTIQPIAEIGAICRDRGVLFHSDAVQALGKVPLDVEECGIDLLSISAHKMYGPKGIGALYIRSRGSSGSLEPLLRGGGQEHGLRPGTLAVPNIVGLGVACELAAQNLATEPARLRKLRDRLAQRLQAGVPGLRVHGHPVDSLPGLLNVSFPGVDGDALVYSLREVAVSQGASCSSGTPQPSHVLLAVGLGPDEARASIRFGIGRFTSEAEIERASEHTVWAYNQLRSTAAADNVAAAEVGPRRV